MAVYGYLFLEKKGNAPKACDTDDGVYDAGNRGSLSAEKIGDQVKLEKTYEQPVDGSDNGDDKRSVIKHDFASFYTHDAFIDSISGIDVYMHARVEEFVFCLKTPFFGYDIAMMDWYVFMAGCIWSAYLLLLSPVTAAFSLSESGFGAGIGFITANGAVKRAQENAAGAKRKKKKRRKLEREIISYLIKHVKLERIFISGVIAFEDKMAAALAAGAVYALSECARKKIVCLARADFASSVSSIEITGILSIKTGHIICAAMKKAEISMREKVKTWKNTRLKD